MKRVLYLTALSLLLTANAGGVAGLARVDRASEPWPIIGCVSLAYGGAITAAYAIRAAITAARHDATNCRHRHRYWRPQGRPAPGSGSRPASDPPEGHQGRHAAAYAAVMAAPLADTQPLPVVLATVPYPPLDLTFDLGEYRIAAHGGVR